MSVRIGILGYGNLGRGVECAIKHNPDMELVAVFTRRNPTDVTILTETAKVYSVNDAEKMKDQIDVLIICGGSATDLPIQTPKYAQWFNVIDSFDTHKMIRSILRQWINPHQKMDMLGSFLLAGIRVCFR